MLTQSLLFLTTVVLAAAAPQAGRGRGRGGRGRGGRGGSCAVPQIRLPVNGGGEELEGPGEGMVLKHVVLGHGYQNYTCSEGSASSSGALAVLYDVEPFYPGHASALADVDSWLSIATMTSFSKDVPLALDPSATDGRVAGAETQVQIEAPFVNPNAPLELAGVGTLSPVGVHFFDSAKVPTFAMDNGDLFKATKLGDLPAPADASAGEDGEAPVKWLYLGDGGGSVNIQFVYRVNTVGGSPHACTADGETDSTEYTAFYYLYGPAE